MSGDRAPEDDPIGPSDDEVIGRAFRASMLALAAVAAIALAAFWIARSGDTARVEVDERPAAVPLPEDREVSVPDLPFRDITVEAGIDFVHESGARGEKLLPETMGGGCAFLDHDLDGDPDLLLVNGKSFDPEEDDRATTRLYENLGGGRFSDATARTGVGVSFHGMGVVAGDMDDDGDPDLYLTGVGRRVLLENREGVYHDVTRGSGTEGREDDWSTAAVLFDYDRDGDLDLYVGNYVRWSREIDFGIDYRLTGVGRAYGPPTQYEGTHSYLFRNQGGLRFEDVSPSAGIRVENPATGKPVGKALGAIPIDIDADGWIDLVVANDTVRNFAFRNRGDGTFEEIGADCGIGYASDGSATGAMGIDAACVRDPDTLAIAIGNFANEMTSLYVDQRVESEILFTDDAIFEGIGPASRLMLTFGLFFFDADLDGRLDLLQANGHLEQEIDVVQPSQRYRQPPQLFWNAGRTSGRTFVPVPNDRTGDFGNPIVGRGAACADIDGDGDLDVLFTQVGDRPVLLRNDQQTGHHFVRFRLEGTRDNRDAVGAWVEIEAGGVRQRQQIMPARSYLSCLEPILTFGLGRADRVESARVTWPDGTVQELREVRVDALNHVRQDP